MAVPTPPGARFRAPETQAMAPAMTPTTRTRTLTLRLQPEPPKGFWGLPRELRDAIYELCLVEPPRWEKRHDALCPAAARECTVLERPPFLSQHHLPSDTCARRRGLGLLAASRRVHDEAFGIFWSRNTFCWPACGPFVAEVGDTLRPDCRERIRHIRIMTDGGVEPRAGYAHYGAAHDHYTKLWRVVRLCDDLRTLAVRPEYLAHHAESVAALGSPLACPRLEALRLVSLLPVDVGAPDGPAAAQYVWIQADRAVGPPAALADAAACEDAARAFTDFLVHVRHAVETQLVGRRRVTGRTERVRPAFDPAAPGHLDDTAGPLRVTLRDVSVAVLRVYGLPIGRATRRRRARERARAAEALRLGGGPTVTEERVRAEVAEQLRQELAAAREMEDRRARRGALEREREGERRAAASARAAQRKKRGRP